MPERNKILNRLLEGNKRYVSGNSLYENQDENARKQLANLQKPYAIVLTCSDSRVPPELIFDAGLGELFVIRTAGHVLSDDVVGSIEYAMRNLEVKFLMILGHTNCGGVQTAVNTYKNDAYEKLTPSLKAVVDHIHPSLHNMEGCDMNTIIKNHILFQFDDILKKDEYISSKLSSNEVALCGAIYHLECGNVEVLNEL